MASGRDVRPRKVRLLLMPHQAPLDQPKMTDRRFGFTMRKITHRRRLHQRGKRVVADLTLDKHMLRRRCEKSLRPARRRELSRWFQEAFGPSVVRACALAGFSRSDGTSGAAQDHAALRLRIRDLAHARPRFGYNRIWVPLRREGGLVNRKRVRRLYWLEGLQVRMRVRRRKHRALHRGPAPTPTAAHERWSRDFVHDQPADGRPFRVLTLVDQWSRQSPILEPALAIGGRDVARLLDRAIGAGPAPRSITGTEFMSRALEDWGLPPSATLHSAHEDSCRCGTDRAHPHRRGAGAETYPRAHSAGGRGGAGFRRGGAP